MMSAARKYSTIGAVVLLWLFLIWLLTLPGTSFGQIDFLQYWAAGRLYLSGGNPYSYTEMSAVEASIAAQSDPVFMWVPPPVFPIILPFSLLSFPWASALWLTAMSVCIVMGVRLSLRSGGHSLFRRIATVMFLVTFYPIPLALSYGQISPLLYCAFAVAMAELVPRSHPVRAWFAGAMLSITLFKPHLLYLVYLWLCSAARDHLARRVLGGMVFGAVILIFLSLTIRPDILSLYFAAAQTPPINFQTPTLGSWVQGLLDQHSLGIRFIPTFMAVAGALPWMVVKFRRESSLCWDVLYVLTPLSLLTSPYGWSFDHLLLLPSVLWVIAGAAKLRSKRLVFSVATMAVLIGANLLVLAAPRNAPMQIFVWYPAVVLLAAVGMRRALGVAPERMPLPCSAQHS